MPHCESYKRLNTAKFSKPSPKSQTLVVFFFSANGNVWNDFSSSFHGFPDKTANVSNAETVKPKFTNEGYQEYLRLKSNSLAQSAINHNFSRACISQYMKGQSPSIIDQVLMSTFPIIPPSHPFPFQKNQHFITLANGSKSPPKE